MMQIVNARRPRNPGRNANGFECIGHFSLRVTEDVILYDLNLVKSPVGKLLIHGPRTTYGAESMSLAPALRAEIVERAAMIFREELNDDRRAA